MGEIRIVGPGKTRRYPYPVCKKFLFSPVMPVDGRDRDNHVSFF